MSAFTYGFKGKVVEHDVGKYRYTVVFVTRTTQKELPLDQYPRLRIRGAVAGNDFEGALQPAKGRWYIMLSKRLLKQYGLDVGCTVQVEFEIADQDAVNLPPELQAALDVDAEVARIWENLTPGKQRSICHHVGSAKQAATKARRVEEAFEWLRDLG